MKGHGAISDIESQALLLVFLEAAKNFHTCVKSNDLPSNRMKMYLNTNKCSTNRKNIQWKLKWLDHQCFNIYRGWFELGFESLGNSWLDQQKFCQFWHHHLAHFCLQHVPQTSPDDISQICTHVFFLKHILQILVNNNICSVLSTQQNKDKNLC